MMQLSVTFELAVLRQVAGSFDRTMRLLEFYFIGANCRADRLKLADAYREWR